MTRETLANIVERYHDRVFLVDATTAREVTYADFHRRSCALAANLRQRGIRRGYRVAVLVQNSCELAALYFASIYIGAVIIPINPSLSKGEIQFILQSCNPAVVIAGP